MSNLKNLNIFFEEGKTENFNEDKILINISRCIGITSKEPQTIEYIKNNFNGELVSSKKTPLEVIENLKSISIHKNIFKELKKYLSNVDGVLIHIQKDGLIFEIFGNIDHDIIKYHKIICYNVFTNNGNFKLGINARYFKEIIKFFIEEKEDIMYLKYSEEENYPMFFPLNKDTHIVLAGYDKTLLLEKSLII